MRNILALVGAATVAFLVAGWYLGWYKISRLPSPNGKQSSVQVDINPNKINEDLKAAGEKGSQWADSLREKPKTEPAPGPATSFFTPTPAPEPEKGSSGGWKPIQKKPAEDDASYFGFNKSRK